MMRLFRSAAWAAGVSFAVLVMGAGQAAGEVIVIGGDGGANWKNGGGDIPATVIRNINTVETTNAPGGVIDFDTAMPNWIQSSIGALLAEAERQMSPLFTACSCSTSPLPPTTLSKQLRNCVLVVLSS